MSDGELGPSRGVSAPGRLVIVDDEPLLLELLGSLFDDGYDVSTCTDGKSAIEAMDQHGVDVLLTDKNLPDVSGFDLMHHARSVQPDAEVLMITGYASLDTALTAIQLGAFDYIVKPPKTIFEVRRKVELAFAKQAMTRENLRLLQHLRSKNIELEAAVAREQATQAELVQSQKLAGLGILAAGVAHEISSPLFGILGLAEAITDEPDLERAQGHAADIVEYAKSIREIVMQLRSYARPAERDFIEPVDVDEVVSNTLTLISRARRLSARVTSDVADGVSLRMPSNELQQILVNLVNNALDAVATNHPNGGGHVGIEVRATDEVVRITVVDDGPGIPEKDRDHVFDPFFTTKPAGQGTGLGLNIVYRLVMKHGGSIRLREEASGGVGFVLTFPDEA